MYAEPKENLIENADHCIHKAAMYLMDANWYLSKAGMGGEASQLIGASKAIGELRKTAIPKRRRRAK